MSMNSSVQKLFDKIRIAIASNETKWFLLSLIFIFVFLFVSFLIVTWIPGDISFGRFIGLSSLNTSEEGFRGDMITPEKCLSLAEVFEKNNQLVGPSSEVANREKYLASQIQFNTKLPIEKEGIIEQITKDGKRGVISSFSRANEYDPFGVLQKDYWAARACELKVGRSNVEDEGSNSIEEKMKTVQMVNDLSNFQTMERDLHFFEDAEIDIQWAPDRWEPEFLSLVYDRQPSLYIIVHIGVVFSYVENMTNTSRSGLVFTKVEIPLTTRHQPTKVKLNFPEVVHHFKKVVPIKIRIAFQSNLSTVHKDFIAVVQRILILSGRKSKHQQYFQAVLPLEGAGFQMFSTEKESQTIQHQTLKIKRQCISRGVWEINLVRFPNGLLTPFQQTKWCSLIYSVDQSLKDKDLSKSNHHLNVDVYAIANTLVFKSEGKEQLQKELDSAIAEREIIYDRVQAVATDLEKEAFWPLFRENIFRDSFQFEERNLFQSSEAQMDDFTFRLEIPIAIRFLSNNDHLVVNNIPGVTLIELRDLQSGKIYHAENKNLFSNDVLDKIVKDENKGENETKHEHGMTRCVALTLKEYSTNKNKLTNVKRPGSISGTPLAFTSEHQEQHQYLGISNLYGISTKLFNVTKDRSLYRIQKEDFSSEDMDIKSGLMMANNYDYIPERLNMEFTEAYRKHQVLASSEVILKNTSKSVLRLELTQKKTVLSLDGISLVEIEISSMFPRNRTMRMHFAGGILFDEEKVSKQSNRKINPVAVVLLRTANFNDGNEKNIMVNNSKEISSNLSSKLFKKRNLVKMNDVTDDQKFSLNGVESYVHTENQSLLCIDPFMVAQSPTSVIELISVWFMFLRSSRGSDQNQLVSLSSSPKNESRKLSNEYKTFHDDEVLKNTVEVLFERPVLIVDFSFSLCISISRLKELRSLLKKRKYGEFVNIPILSSYFNQSKTKMEIKVSGLVEIGDPKLEFSLEIDRVKIYSSSFYTLEEIQRMTSPCLFITVFNHLGDIWTFKEISTLMSIDSTIIAQKLRHSMYKLEQKAMRATVKNSIPDTRLFGVSTLENLMNENANEDNRKNNNLNLNKLRSQIQMSSADKIRLSPLFVLESLCRSNR